MLSSVNFVSTTSKEVYLLFLQRTNVLKDVATSVQFVLAYSDYPQSQPFLSRRVERGTMRCIAFQGEPLDHLMGLIETIVYEINLFTY